MAKFDIKSDGYGGIQEITKQLKCEKKSLILWLEFLNTKVLEQPTCWFYIISTRLINREALRWWAFI